MVNIASEEQLVDAFVERRRSMRHLGKERLCYAPKSPSPVEKKPVKKKAKSVPAKKTVKTLLDTDEPNIAAGSDHCSSNSNGVDEVAVNEIDACEKKRKLNFRASCVAPEAEIKSVANAGVPKTAHQRVKETLRMFNTNYLQAIQEEENRVRVAEEKAKKRETAEKRASKRPDLKAITKMQNNNQVLYPVKRIGSLPGIEVGDQFFSRAEMCVLGLHSHWLNGIDYMGQSFAKLEQYKDYTFPLAVCIVISGMYEDDLDNSEDVIYTGQGGHDLLGSKHQIADQKMERGNLALKNNFLTQNPVRVIRGHGSRDSYCGKVYTYDGLYQVVKFWAEKGVSKFTVFKYQLRRVEGQPILTTNQVQFIRGQVPKSLSDVQGLVCKDISGGQENIPIPATNLVDDPPFAPKDFEYCKSIRLSKNFKLPATTGGCDCKGECINPNKCSCAKLNGGDFPYVRKDGGRLIEAKAVVFECGPSCGCSGTCVNRVSQQGIRYHLEVFKTAHKGWAVRSWDTIPSGAPICEYTGILSRSDDNAINSVVENNYIFDIDCLQTIKGLDGRERRPGDMAVLENIDDKKAEVEFCIDAGRVGNVARFINHSCSPNLFVQCVLSAHHDIRVAKVMLFAADTIPPLQELCYDYGYVLDSVARSDGTIVKLPCYCGAVGCRKRLH